MDEFKCARQQLSLEKFETKFDALVKKYPKAENYLKVSTTAAYDGPSTCPC